LVNVNRATHWGAVYASRPEDQVSWYEPVPSISLRFVREAIQSGGRSLIDIGGGASTLVDHLVDLDLDRVTVLDVAAGALATARKRLGDKASRVEWIEGDVTAVRDVGRFDIWHDRALLHFLTDADDRDRYRALCERTLLPGGTAIIATFAPDGPTKCSGLQVQRYGEADLVKLCGPTFNLVESVPHLHTTPGGSEQRFMYAAFRRVAEVPASIGGTHTRLQQW
jgi:SAM-dependent methyltransferase